MSHEQPTTEIDPREVITAYLERERVDWLSARARAERSGHMNASANEAEAKSMRQIDALLEELHAIGGQAVAQCIERPQTA